MRLVYVLVNITVDANIFFLGYESFPDDIQTIVLVHSGNEPAEYGFDLVVPKARQGEAFR